MTERNQTAHITVTVAARRTGMEPGVVRHCVQLGLVSEGLTEANLVELRRVRRLTNLGVNLAGVWRLSCACVVGSRNCKWRGHS